MISVIIQKHKVKLSMILLICEIKVKFIEVENGMMLARVCKDEKPRDGS